MERKRFQYRGFDVEIGPDKVQPDKYFRTDARQGRFAARLMTEEYPDEDMVKDWLDYQYTIWESGEEE